MDSGLSNLKNVFSEGQSGEYFVDQTSLYYINIAFPVSVRVENNILRNVIINRGAAVVDNHILPSQ